MNWLKAALVVLLGASLTLWFGAEGLIPLPDPAESFAAGVVGMAALALGGAVRALGTVLMPLAALARLLIVPGVIGVLIWLALRRRAR